MMTLSEHEKIIPSVSKVNLKSADGFYVVCIKVKVAESSDIVLHKSYKELRVFHRKLCDMAGADGIPKLPNVGNFVWKRRKLPICCSVLEKLMKYKYKKYITKLSKLPPTIVQSTVMKDFFLNRDSDPSSDRPVPLDENTALIKVFSRDDSMELKCSIMASGSELVDTIEKACSTPFGSQRWYYMDVGGEQREITSPDELEKGLKAMDRRISITIADK